MGPQRPFGLHEAFIRALRRIDLVVVLVKADCFLLEWIAIEHLQDPEGHLVTIRWDEGDPCRRFTHLAEPAFPPPVASRILRHQKAFVAVSIPSGALVQKVESNYQPQLKVYTMFAQLGSTRGSPAENCRRPSPTAAAIPGQMRI